MSQGITGGGAYNNAMGQYLQSRPSDDGNSWVCETGTGGNSSHTCYARYGGFGL